MSLRRVFPLLVVIASSACFGQLTTDQKVLDFQQISGLYAKKYAPYEWKTRLTGFDLLNAEPWLARIRASRTDLEFFDIVREYVASLDDGHSEYSNPSNFVARLNFGVDLYDGRLLVDFVNRTRLPAAEFPFVSGYELVSIDGVPATQLLQRYNGLVRLGNPQSTLRYAAQLITLRPQVYILDAPSVPEVATVVFRRFDGNTETYRIPWTRTGVPLSGRGKLPTPGGAAIRHAGGAGGELTDEPVVFAPEEPEYMKPLRSLWTAAMPSRRAVNGIGAITPVYVRGLPGTFVQRLGRLPSDLFFSGTFTSGSYRLGLIRIPDFGLVSREASLSQFAREIAYLQENTDGLIVDETRNPGGYVDYQNDLLTLLHHYPFRAMGFQVRATSAWITDFSSARELAAALGAPQEIVGLYDRLIDQLRGANRTSRGLTEPIPIDDFELMREPARDARGNLIGYTKPLIVLVDEFSASGGDAFAASIQDSGRGPLFGTRTMGLGGTVVTYDAGAFSEGYASVTESLMVRQYERANSGYPVTTYLENIGVRADIQYDPMTRDNLLQNFRPYVSAFTDAMVNWIDKVNREASQQ